MEGDLAHVDGADRPAGWLDRGTALVRIYTRAFLSQGAGFVGLVWCLQEALPWAAGTLTVLLLVDQVVFLRGRAAMPGSARLQTGLDIWCILVSCADVLIFCASLFRAAGLREPGGALVSDPVSCLAFAVATLARLDLGLAPVGGGGRMVAALEALAGDVVLLAGAALLVRAALREPPDPTRR